MGFFGNITYNTYGIQDGQVEDKHLKEKYWKCCNQGGIEGYKNFRDFLGLPIPEDKDGNKIPLSQEQWDEKWKKAEQKIFKFHFAPSDNDETTNTEKTEQQLLRQAFGNGMLIGWVRKTSNGEYLYAISFGNRTGQIFCYPISRTEYYSLNEKDNNIDACLDPIDEPWYNYILSKGTVITSQIHNEAVTEDKIASNAISTIKIQKDAVREEKIKDGAITNSKIASYSIMGGTDAISGGGKIAQATITEFNIADNTITERTIQNGAITGGENACIAEKTVTYYNIANNTIIKENINTDNKFFISVETFDTEDDLIKYFDNFNLQNDSFSDNDLFYFTIKSTVGTPFGSRSLYRAEIVPNSWGEKNLKIIDIKTGEIYWYTKSLVGSQGLDLLDSNNSIWSNKSYIKMTTSLDPNSIISEEINIGDLAGYANQNTAKVFMCVDKTSSGTPNWVQLAIADNYVEYMPENEVLNILKNSSKEAVLPLFFKVRGELYSGMDRVNPEGITPGAVTALKSRNCTTGEIRYFYWTGEGGDRIASVSSADYQGGCVFGCQEIGSNKPQKAVIGQLFFSVDDQVLYICTRSSGEGISAEWTGIKGYTV